MGAVYFYHLTQSRLEAAVGLLAQKSVAAGWKVELRGTSEAGLKALDDALWMREGFLPHGRAGGDHDALQPILLRLETEPPLQAPSCVISVGGAEVSEGEINQSERSMIVFEGQDPEAVQRARVQWKTLTDTGVEAVYWSEETGKWSEKARANGSE